jgi:hypothetical protein
MIHTCGTWRFTLLRVPLLLLLLLLRVLLPLGRPSLQMSVTAVAVAVWLQKLLLLLRAARQILSLVVRHKGGREAGGVHAPCGVPVGLQKVAEVVARRVAVLRSVAGPVFRGRSG